MGLRVVGTRLPIECHASPECHRRGVEGARKTGRKLQAVGRSRGSMPWASGGRYLPVQLNRNPRRPLARVRSSVLDGICTGRYPGPGRRRRDTGRAGWKADDPPGKGPRVVSGGTEVPRVGAVNLTGSENVIGRSGISPGAGGRPASWWID